MTALVYGVTGLIGGKLLSIFTESIDYQNVIIYIQGNLHLKVKK